MNEESQIQTTYTVHTMISEFLHKKASEDKNWTLWIQFVLHDWLAYNNIHVAVRTKSWDLRIASLKDMAPVFFCLQQTPLSKVDLTTSLRLINLRDVVRSTDIHVLAKLKDGSFATSITGRPWHSVAIDEAHEMMINKDYRIAGNFQGRKPSRFYSHPQKFSPRNFRHATPIYAISLPFREVFSTKCSFLPICKSFLPWKFPTIRYIQAEKIWTECHSVPVTSLNCSTISKLNNKISSASDR